MATSPLSTAPVVSFVVPCYKLAHLLPQCVNSILGQSYGNFEILILDDCSPDNTAEVARSFQDSRVHHHRNSPNLGHLCNYNKGIGLARGAYIWLVSADDFLCRPDVLEEYVRVMESHPNVGYACASGFELTDDGNSCTAAYSKILPEDHIFDRRRLLKVLLRGNAILASSGLVRRTCYEQLGAFPLDLPYAGDWYLWCLFALHYDAAYFAREAVTYRLHVSSMTESLLGRDAGTCVADDLKVLWRIKEHVRQTGSRSLVKDCHSALGRYYARYLVSQSYRTARFHFTDEEFVRSVNQFAESSAEARAVSFHVNRAAGDLSFRKGDSKGARKYTLRALRQRPWLLGLWIKTLLLFLGGVGKAVRILAAGVLHGGHLRQRRGD